MYRTAQATVRFHATVTRNALSSSWYPVSRRRKMSITIKPERLLEPCLERGLVGGVSLTLMVAHAQPKPSVLVTCILDDMTACSLVHDARPCAHMIPFTAVVHEKFCLVESPCSLQYRMRSSCREITLRDILGHCPDDSENLLVMISQPRLRICVRPG